MPEKVTPRFGTRLLPSGDGPLITDFCREFFRALTPGSSGALTLCELRGHGACRTKRIDVKKRFLSGKMPDKKAQKLTRNCSKFHVIILFSKAGFYRHISWDDLLSGRPVTAIKYRITYIFI